MKYGDGPPITHRWTELRRMVLFVIKADHEHVFSVLRDSKINSVKIEKVYIKTRALELTEEHIKRRLMRLVSQPRDVLKYEEVNIKTVAEDAEDASIT